MENVGPRKDLSTSSQPDINLEISIAVFNQKTKQWEKGDQELAKKTVAFMSKEGKLKLLNGAKAGEIFRFTDKGVYKKQGENWIRALDSKEAKEKLPTIRRVMLVLSQHLQGVSTPLEAGEVPQEFIEAKAPQVILQVKVGGKEGESAKAEKTDHLLEGIGKAALVAGKCLAGLQKQFVLIGKGKAKRVFKKISDAAFAYIVPIKGLFSWIINFKEREIRKEVQTTKTIVSNLQQAKLTKILQNSPLKERAVELSHSSVKRFGSVEKMVQELERDPSSVAKKMKMSKEEAQVFSGLQTQFKEVLESGKNLASEMEEVEESEKIEGQYTVKAPLSQGDLEKQLRTENNDFSTRTKFVSGLFRGMGDLHQAGFVHGDLKPENLLVYEKEIDGKLEKYVKVADFGKTTALTANEDALYVGNPYFSSPEARLSQKGEVFSSALVAIRILEESYLNEMPGGMLTSPLRKESLPISEIRRGVERFVLQSKDFPQVEVSNLRGKVKVYSYRGQAALSRMSQKPELKGTQKEIHRYIDTLTTKIQEKEDLDPSKTHQLNQLLKDMTQVDPQKRPTMEIVSERFEEIGLQSLGSENRP